MPDLHSLISRFHNDPRRRSAAYNETEARVQYINPLFEFLGWDMGNRTGRNEVKHEDKVTIRDKAKAPDYGFYLDGRRKFFVEAKKPAVNIGQQAGPAYQLRRYAWTAKLPLSVLTDFEEFAVYDTRVRPQQGDRADAARIGYWTYEQYPDAWDEIAATFSREAVLGGSLEQFAEARGGKRGVAPVDAELLREIERWRELLARNIALRNPGLTERDLNFAVQQTIDRLLFLRIAEDRAIEPYGRLKDLLTGGDVYSRLMTVYTQADARYNSGLFHFAAERGRGDPDYLTPRLNIDDKALHDIIRNLYEPVSPYEFSVFPADILGQVYEQFLGKVIRLSGKSARVEEKPEVRKAGGVYYTPTYIVEYIVQQTVGRLLEHHAPDPTGPVSRLRVLDPACGSGSFLLGAYQYLLDWHLRGYLAAPSKWSKGRGRTLHQTAGGEYHLTLAERKRILLDNLYGVDIDPQAVEVTKLSLLLKVLEDSADALTGQMALLPERVLPDLGENIKCGNSLIGPDFFDNQLLPDPQEYERINPCDWRSQFKGIMASGGFNAVIGNPPYGAALSDSERRHLTAKFGVGSTDTAALMMAQAHRLVKSGGLVSFIVPKPFTYASNWKGIRELLFPDIVEVVDTGKVWREVKLEQVIFQSQVDTPSTSYRTAVREGQSIIPLGVIDKSDADNFGFILNGISSEELEIGECVKDTSIPLSQIVSNTRGGMFQKLVQNEPAEIKVLGGAQIARYRIVGEKGFIDSKKELTSNAYILPNSLLVQNIVAHIANPTPHIKIIGTTIAEGERGNYAILDTVNQLTVMDNGYSPKFILGVLHSKLINWYVYRFIFGKAIRTMHFDGPVTSRIPIPDLNLDPATGGDLMLHDQVMYTVEGITDLEQRILSEGNPQAKRLLHDQLALIYQRLDSLMYRIYGLSDSQVEIVETGMP